MTWQADLSVSELLVYWDIYAQPSREFPEMVRKGKKYSASSSSGLIMACWCQKRKVDPEIVNVDVQPTNLQMRCNAVMSMEQNVCGMVPAPCCICAAKSRRPLLKAKGSSLRYQQGVPNKVASDSLMTHTKVRHSGFVLYFFLPVIHTLMISMIVLLPFLNINISTTTNNYNNKTVLCLCLCRAVRGAVGDGNAHSPEVAGLRGGCDALCHFRLLCGVDCLHPSHHGGTLSFSARAPFTLVRLSQSWTDRKAERVVRLQYLVNTCWLTKTIDMLHLLNVLYVKWCSKFLIYCIYWYISLIWHQVMISCWISWIHIFGFGLFWKT